MKATLGRLPVYLRYLKELDPAENGNISATIIAKALGLGEVQVRKDLNSVSGAGRPKLGYKTSALIKRLEEVLGQNRISKAIIIGAGKLGNALLEYNGFANYGLEISAAFDIDENKIGNTEFGKPIYCLDSLEEYCKAQEIKIAVITVPAAAAQSICNRLTDCGITAVWNFAPCQLNVPDGILLQNENLALSLAHLKLQMNNQ
ncbi:MAG: redox-sensing transcriptional repressor Rex [Ruminococcaceae bacterium]|nr:redox-sensing transcriptional repressor Rex [Oscillospiraceae bacterium]